MRPRRRRGFTLIELVLVLLVVGVLAVVALPVALDFSAWRLKAFADDLQSSMASLQRKALAQRRPIQATLASTGVQFTYVSDGSLIRALACPAATPNCLSASSVGNVVFNSGNSGAAVTSTGASLAVTVTDGGANSYNFQLDNDSGVLRRLP